MLSTHLIVDEFASNGRVGVFWKKIESHFMAQMAPASVSQTHSENSVAALTDEAVKNGARKIILVGDERTIFIGINALMQLPQESRQKLAIGLWPLQDWDMLLYATKLSNKLPLLAQVFKAGQTFSMDFGKVSLVRNEQPPQNLYFGKQCLFSYVETSQQTMNLASGFLNSLARFLPFHILSQGQLQIEYQSFYGTGGLRVNILLHPFPLHSFHITPEDLTQNPKFSLFWQKGLSAGNEWFHFPIATFSEKQKGWRKVEKKNCLSIKVAIWNGPLSLTLDGQPHLCTQAQFKIVRKALPIIIKMAPVRFKEPVKLWGALKSKGMVANRKPL